MSGAGRPPARIGSWGVQQFRRRPTWRSSSIFVAATRSRPIRCSNNLSPPWRRIRFCCRGPGRAACRSWPIRRSTQAGLLRHPRLEGGRRARYPGATGDTGGAGVGMAARRRLRDPPQSGNPGACARENRGALEIRPHLRMILAELFSPFHGVPPPNRKADAGRCFEILSLGERIMSGRPPTYRVAPTGNKRESHSERKRRPPRQNAAICHPASFRREARFPSPAASLRDPDRAGNDIPRRGPDFWASWCGHVPGDGAGPMRRVASEPRATRSGSF